MSTKETKMLIEAEIDKLDGRTLDMAVAEVVYDRNRMTARIGFEHGEPEYSWGYPMGHGRAPEYSTDLVTAFAMAQYIAERLFQTIPGDPGFINDLDVHALSLYQCSSIDHPGAWVAAFMDFKELPDELEPANLQGLRAVAEGPTPQVAICRAALKVFCLPTKRPER